jgi:hypothetical protein
MRKVEETSAASDMRMTTLGSIGKFTVALGGLVIAFYGYLHSH